MTPPPRPARGRSRRAGWRDGGWRGLGGRATLAFAGLALVLSLLISGVVWATVSRYLLVQREQSTFAQTLAHADQVQRSLGVDDELTPPQVLAQLPRRLGSTSVLQVEDSWYTSNLTVGPDDLPEALREEAASGYVVRQRVAVDGEVSLVMGVPLVYPGMAYFEVFPLDDLDRAYRVLAGVLLLSVLVLSLAALLLGRHVLRPALRPLQEVASATARFAQGDLGVRLAPSADPQLSAIAASFNETADSLERRLRADARFAADVSHELRTPLTTMMSAVALAAAYEDRLPEDGREALRLLRSEVDRFHRLVEDLLDISRADAGSADVAWDLVAPAQLVHRGLRPELRERVVVTAAGAGALVCGDKRRLERVVANLVDNAETHGGGLSRLTVDVVGDQVVIVVDDDGPGLDAEDRDRVFDRFARGRGAIRDSSGGAGLGLALVARHVQVMGGSVRAENRPQGGARFVVNLPVAQEEEA